MEKRTTIRRKLMAAFMATSSIVLLLSCAVFITFGVLNARALMSRRLTMRAEMLAASSTAALAFQDERAAKEILSTLRKDPHTIGACLYDKSGRLFATYPDGVPPEAFPRVPEAVGHRFEKSQFVLFQPVIEGDRLLGTLYLRSDLLDIAAQIRQYALVALVIMMGSIGVAFALAIYFQKRISQPILALSRTARGIAEHKDFSTRAEKVTDDEIGSLTSSFNDMLSEIQERDCSLRKSEAGLRAVLESALDCIITMDHEGRIIEFNPAAEDTFGVSRAEALGSNVGSLIMPESLGERGREVFARYLSGRGSTVLGRRVEMTARRADGSEFPVELAVVRIAQEGPPRFTGFVRDITEQKRAEHEIRQLNEELEQRVVERTLQFEAANEELQAFSYSVSHDLRAPLRGIDGFSQILLEDYSGNLNEEARGYLQRVRSGCQKMGGLIDDMLALAQVTRREMQVAVVDLTGLAASIAEELRGSGRDRKANFVIHEGVKASGDARLLRIALENLLGNAWKFTGNCGETRIEFGTLQRETGPAYFVKDNGAGFDMRHKDKLFGAFQRLHTQQEFEGSGIGLATVARVIQRHGGRVWAESEVGRGTTFYFTLRGETSHQERGSEASRTEPATSYA